MSNSFLVLAYWFLWSIFILYAGVIHRRQRRLEKELQEMKSARRGR
jgi:preprotein translocase subunit YajC